MFLKDNSSINDIIESRESIVSCSNSVFKELSIEPSMIFEIKVAHFSIEISQLLTTNMSTGVVRKLNSCLTIGFDNIGFNLRPAFRTLTNDSVMS
jgi:hypothetical protein